jgi:hypothetical protein
LARNRKRSGRKKTGQPAMLIIYSTDSADYGHVLYQDIYIPVAAGPGAGPHVKAFKGYTLDGEQKGDYRDSHWIVNAGRSILGKLGQAAGGLMESLRRLTTVTRALACFCLRYRRSVKPPFGSKF